MYLGNIKAKMPIDNYECCYGSITKIPNKQINKQMQQLNSTLDGQWVSLFPSNPNTAKG